jgi:hypothetical protein
VNASTSECGARVRGVKEREDEIKESMRLSSGRKRGEIRERRGENDFVNLRLASYHGNKLSLLFRTTGFYTETGNCTKPKSGIWVSRDFREK